MCYTKRAVSFIFIAVRSRVSRVFLFKLSSQIRPKIHLYPPRPDFLRPRDDGTSLVPGLALLIIHQSIFMSKTEFSYIAIMIATRVYDSFRFWAFWLRITHSPMGNV